ncbi:aryl hydrocarbon receptor-like [Parambassis ranga]|uniref:Aryl hydrocarbon receptor n=1 Tax=Parambassis ranga TaxID=210632 RepID=A0A6P7H6Y6_9TELE|nr:aryl hydrocarbon receptor-like [Parambassis ranga]
MEDGGPRADRAGRSELSDTDTMLGNPGTYANKKRKKPVLKQKKISDGSDVVKSNPSKRHRDRLNGELDRLMELLPFPEEIRSRLDKLSVLRLSVGYLRVKSHFKATMKSSNGSLSFPAVGRQNGGSTDTAGLSEGDLLLQALNGFVMVVTSDGSVFYASSTIKDYLGFHQSDIVHQSVFELIHTDDRALFREQLHFALDPPPVAADGNILQGSVNPVLYSPEQLPPENSSFLERSFVCRFRCLLDNSSGFLALKFQGRLKFLHGQNLLKDNGSCSRPQLALFTIAVPVQPPSIVEIRAKMLLFQSKHKLDFTPMGIDSRGKIILGYSETELCMKGSGYQFIHAADMMYCADNHIRMIKTGESGLTVFRLLSKSGGWVWVKANAKLIYKGGRPEFIIAYQRALVNAEGEEYLRQRRLQLPFSFTTGEAVLYNTGPTVDVAQFQFNKMFSSGDMKADVSPGSLLDCFLRQDEMAYTQRVEAPLPVDQVFMNSRALVSVASDAWQGNEAVAMTGEPVVVKKEAKQSVMAVIGGLEKMAQSGDFCSALQNLEVGEVELMEWEDALKRLGQDEDHSNVRSDLDSVLTNDIFDYIESVLFKEKGESPTPPSCLSEVCPFSELCEPQLFQAPSPGYSPVSGLYAHQQGAVNGTAVPEPGQRTSSSQRLSHQGPLPPRADPGLPPLQELQLQDIFSPSIELPELTVPLSADGDFQACGRAGSRHRGGPAPAQQLLQSSAQPPNSAMDILPPLIPCTDFSPSNGPVGFSAPCLQKNVLFERRSLQQKLAPAGTVQNGHDSMPAFRSQTSQSQTFPRAGLWPQGVTGLNHPQPGPLAGGQAAAHNSCVFSQHFPSGPAGGGALSLSGAPDLRGDDAPLEQSPPHGSCYFQWSSSQPVVGTSAISQENATVSPLTTPSNMSTMSSSEHAHNIQHYLDSSRQTQQIEGFFVPPGPDMVPFLME